MWNVRAGDLVVYRGPPTLKSEELGWAKAPNGLIFNGIYTIEYAFTENAAFGDELYLCLVENTRDAFISKYFRPVAKPSIENLRQLTTKPDLVKESA